MAKTKDELEKTIKALKEVGISASIGYETNCEFCKKKMTGKTKKEVQKDYETHLKKCKKYQGDLKAAKFVEECKAKGIWDEMKVFLKGREIADKLRKLIKKYGYKTVEKELEFLEGEIDD